MMVGDGSYLEKDDKRFHLSREGKCNVVSFTIYKKVKRANVVTMKGIDPQVSKVEKEMRTMRMGPAPGMEDETKPLSEEESEAARQVEPCRVRR